MSRWLVPEDRREEEKEKAFRTVGDLELHLYLGRNGEGKAIWEPVRIQPRGFPVDAEHQTPYQVSGGVGWSRVPTEAIIS